LELVASRNSARGACADDPGENRRDATVADRESDMMAILRKEGSGIKE
jgi:hypothetical protein